MLKTKQRTDVSCNECTGPLTPLGTNRVGRPVYRCKNCEQTQVGPF